MKQSISDIDPSQSPKGFAEGPAETTVYLEPTNPIDSLEEQSDYR